MTLKHDIDSFTTYKTLLYNWTSRRMQDEGVGALEFVPGIKVKGQPTADNAGCIMTQQKISCLAAVLVSLCATFMPGGTNGCTGERTCTLCVNFWIVVVVYTCI